MKGIDMAKFDDGSVSMTLRFPGDIYYFLQKLAEKDRRSMNQEVFHLIEQAAIRMKIELNHENPNVYKHFKYEAAIGDNDLPIHESTPVYDSPAKESSWDSIDYIDIIEIPVLGSTAAGKRIDFGDLDPNPPTRPWAAPLIKGGKKDYYCVLVKGDSMTEADIFDGDYALLKHTSDAENSEIMLVRHDDSSTLKRIKVIEGKNGQKETLICWEDGSGHTEKLEEEGFEIQGKLVAIGRSKRGKKKK